MIQQGGWSWNSGMFFFRISTAEKALERLQPAMYRVYQEITAAIKKGDGKAAVSLYENFAAKISHPLELGREVDNSIDYAILTPMVSGPESGVAAYAVRNVRFQWTDLGQWTRASPSD